MDGVLEAATALCVCKVTCSLLFLPTLAACFSPVSFCSCCLLIFTDFLVAVFLSFLCVFESWLSTGVADAVALRFLLFLSYTYGAVLLLTTPLIAVETLVRLLWPHTLAVRRTRSRLLDCLVLEAKEEEEEDEEEEKDRKLFHVIGYFSCLSLWAIVAFKIRWRWRLGEAWAAACMHRTSSLVKCLPRMHSPVPSVGPPCWSLVFVVLFLILLLLVLVTSSLDRRTYAPAESSGTGGEIQPVPPAPACRGDPEKTASSCRAHGVQMSASLHGDEALASPACLSGERGRREQERTKRGGAPLTFTTEEDGSRCRWRLGVFPRPGADVMIGFVGLLSVFVLPLYLSVNILVIRTLETLLEDCIISLVSPPVHTGDAPPSRNDTLV